MVSHGNEIWAIEVKSGRPGRQSGIEAFRKLHPKARVWLIGPDGVTLEDFFSRPASHWFQ